MASGGHSSSRCAGLSRCGAQAPDVQAQQLWLTGPAALRHVGSSQARARTRVPCISRQILKHCATREAPVTIFENLDLRIYLCPFPHLFILREGFGCHCHNPGYKSRKLGSRESANMAEFLGMWESGGFEKNHITGTRPLLPISIYKRKDHFLTLMFVYHLPCVCS